MALQDQLAASSRSCVMMPFIRREEADPRDRERVDWPLIGGSDDSR